MRSLTAAILLTALFTLPAMAQSWGVQQGSWNVPRIPTTNLNGSWGVKSESYGVQSGSWGVKPESYGVQSGSWGVKPESYGVQSGSWGVKSESYGVESGSWGLKPIEPVKGWLDSKPGVVKEMNGAQVDDSPAPNVCDKDGISP